MNAISSREQLLEWLEDKPVDWARIIAMRAAGRALPFLGTWRGSDDLLDRLALFSFRNIAISWAARSFPAYDFEAAAFAAFSAFNASVASTSFSVGSDAAIAAFAAASDCASAASAAPSAALAASAATLAVSATGIANTAAADNDWSAITVDCQWLDADEAAADVATRMTALPLWFDGPDSLQTRQWQEMVARLISSAPHWRVWIDWYDRRLQGHEAAFDIPGDTDRTEDKALLIRLADATDATFWSKGAEHANMELQRWLDEARARAAQQLNERQAETADKQAAIDIPRQNPNALQFSRGKTGRIAIIAAAGADSLKTDPDARDRHKNAVDFARSLLGRCAGSNSAERLTRLLEQYVASAGDSIEEMKPSLFVLRGEQVRQDLAAYEAPDSDFPPLPDELRLDLQSLCKAHNMVVGLDPALVARDTAMLGPDHQPVDVSPQEVRAFVQNADSAGILETGVAEVVIASVELVPSGADSGDRRFRWCAESGRNLICEAFALALNRPLTAVGIATVLSAFDPVSLIGSPLACAILLVTNRAWIERQLGRHAPTWNALFVELCDQLKANNIDAIGKG